MLEMRFKDTGLSRERMAGHCRVKRGERKAALRKAAPRKAALRQARVMLLADTPQQIPSPPPLSRKRARGDELCSPDEIRGLSCLLPGLHPG